MNKVIFLFVLIFSFSACDKSEVDENPQEKDKWELVWADEFNADSLNTTIWKASETPKIITARTSRTKNLRIEDGILIMELHQENYDGESFTGSEITTNGAKLYGKFECRAKLPSASRAWPVFWLLGDFGEYGEWPKCGEVDIIEYWGYNDPYLYTNIHTEYSNWQNTFDRENHSTSITLADAKENFHIYTLEWYTDHMDFLVDGIHYWTYEKLDDSWEKWPFDKPMHVLFQLYAAPDWNGPDLDLPAQFEIDYVRIYDLVE